MGYDDWMNCFWIEANPRRRKSSIEIVAPTYIATKESSDSGRRVSPRFSKKKMDGERKEEEAEILLLPSKQEKALRFVVGLFSILNLSCGLPIVMNLITPRYFVPNLMENFSLPTNGHDTAESDGGNDGLNISDVERLYNIVFGLLAIQFGIIRLLAFQNWQYTNTASDTSAKKGSIFRYMTASTFIIEGIRDGIMYKEGFVGLDEAIAFVPALVIGALVLVRQCAWCN